MPTVTAKAFRQQVLRPAEGLFLFHARAIERLIEEQLGARLFGVSVPDLPYYLMPRADFLLGLESENAEALSVIEGLPLPNYVILLPSPSEQGWEDPSLRRLRLDYWARTFEAEVARGWQNSREDDQDLEQYGAAGLRRLIGDQAFAEVREVLARDGVTLPIWDDDLICRSFVAMVVRLRYFAPGARGYFFPAIQVWAQVDDWLAASGLDLPEPRQGNRLPILLMRSRPGPADLPAEPPLLPLALPYGASDPDRNRALASARPANGPGGPTPRGAPHLGQQAPPAVHRAAPEHPGEPPRGDPGQDLAQRCLAALERGARLRRCPGRLRRLRDGLGAAGRRLLGRLLLWPTPEELRWIRRKVMPQHQGRASQTRGEADPLADPFSDLLLAVLQDYVAHAQRAELDGRFALALARLADARRLAQRLAPAADQVPAVVEMALAAREAMVEQHLTDLLAAKWKLRPAIAGELGELIARLAAEDRYGTGSASARALLRHLGQVLQENRNDYYRLQIGQWLLSAGRRPVRQMLPFQSLLKALHALEGGRARLDELAWPMADIDRFGQTLEALAARVTGRLDLQLTPRLERAMREADFVPRDHRERVAAHKMKLELLDVIKRRRHLKFTDVRDVVARNILRLPDPTLREVLHGDRLSRFDRTAARALPGVYRPGELYIKGLQQLGAPLFGTPRGRLVLRHLLIPFGSAFLALKSLDLLLALLLPGGHDLHLTTWVSVGLVGTLINAVLHTGIGRHLVVSLGEGTLSALRFLLYDGIRELLQWPPMARLLKTGLVRGLWRNLVQPMLIGTLPLIPIIALAVLVEEVPIRPGLWLAGLAFALGTLARNTPGGRRFLDNLSTWVGLYLRRINQTLFIGLIQQLLRFFKEVMQGFALILHRVDEALTHHIGERPDRMLLKAILAPAWRFAEALIQFYVTVLVEPQVNPVKHFPIVTIGHKILLPFLPAITAAFVDISGSVLPKVISYPLVTLTIALLPGLFGFLVWELKENWRLYEANHGGDLGGSGIQTADGAAARDAVGALAAPAMVGAHGETMTGLMTRGFHSGAVPKGFDRLRKVIRDEIQEQRPLLRRLRRVQRQLQEAEEAIATFFERELVFALREHCRDPDGRMQRIASERPRIATGLIELTLSIYPTAPREPGAARPTPPPDPLRLHLRLSRQDRRLRIEVGLAGETERIAPECWSLIRDDLRLIAGRVGADPSELDLTGTPLGAIPEGDAAGPGEPAVFPSNPPSDIGRVGTTLDTPPSRPRAAGADLPAPGDALS